MKEVIGFSRRKHSRSNKRVLGLVELVVETLLEDPIEFFSQPSIFDILKKQKALCLSSSSLHNTFDRGRSEGADSYSSETILCCDPTSDSDVRHCNFRFWENLDSNIGDKVWNGISNLGIVAMDKRKDYSKKISDIEAKDKVRNQGKKRLSILHHDNWNIEHQRGRQFSKRKRISNRISSGNAKIFFIQEFKLKYVDSATISSLWRNQDIGWSNSNVIGQPGGIITLWNINSVEHILSFKLEVF